MVVNPLTREQSWALIDSFFLVPIIDSLITAFLSLIIDSPMQRLDQSHLYPNLAVPGLTCSGRESNPGLPRGKRAL
jgi:hypothetical protein